MATVFILLDEDTFGCSVHIFILSAAQRPQKGDEAETAQEKCDRDEIDKRRQGAILASRRVGLRSCVDLPFERRNALAMTRTDDSDIAMAAINGVT